MSKKMCKFEDKKDTLIKVGSEIKNIVDTEKLADSATTLSLKKLGGGSMQNGVKRVCGAGIIAGFAIGAIGTATAITTLIVAKKGKDFLDKKLAEKKSCPEKCKKETDVPAQGSENSSKIEVELEVTSDSDDKKIEELEKEIEKDFEEIEEIEGI